MPQSIDELLRLAKASLNNADQLESHVRTDVANAPAGDLADFGPDMDTTGFQQTVQNAKRFGSTFLHDAGNAALGLGKLVTSSPFQAAQDTGNQIVGDFIQHGAGQGAASAAESLTGLPIRQVGSDFAQGNYPEAAAHLAVGGLAALLFHKAGTGAGEPEMAPTGRAVRWAPSESPAALGPELPPPSTEPYVGGKASPLKALLGMDPQAFEAPSRAAGTPTGNPPLAEPRFPTMSDEAAAGHVPSAEGYDPYLPNTAASSHLPADSAALPLDTGFDRYMPNQGAPEPTPSARFAFHQDDFEGGSFPMYHIEGGPSDGSTVSAATLADQGIPVPETPPNVARTAPVVAPNDGIVAQKPRISASEFSNILKGREKFAQKNPGADLPPGARDEMDRMGLEYSRTQSELKRLLGLDAPTPEEAADLPRFQQAARELGSRLRKQAVAPAAPSSPTPSAAPTSLADMLRASLDAQNAAPRNGPREPGHFKLPEAAVDDATFARAADAVRRKNPGYQADQVLIDSHGGPDQFNGQSHDMQGAGGDRQFAAKRAKARAFSKRATPTGGEPIQTDLGPEYAPADQGDGLLGGLLKGEEGSYNPEALKQTFSPENRRKFSAIAQAQQAGALLFSPLTIGRIGVSNTFASLLKAAEHAADAGSFAPIGRTVRELGNLPQMARDAVDAFKHPDEIHSKLDPGTQARGLFGVASRAVGAVDRPFRNAMERAGFSPEDALSVTQQRTPLTDTGKKLLAAQQSTALTRLLIPFAKSGINLGEQGIIEPLQSAAKIALLEGKPSDAVKVGAATGAGLAGYYGSKKLDEANAPNWVKRLALATTGQYEVPASLAQAALESSNLADFSKEAARNVPVIGPGLDLSPKALVHRAIPRALNPDFWTGTQRDTTDPRTGKQSDLRQIQAEVPGLAQLLRIKRSTRPARRAHP